MMVVTEIPGWDLSECMMETVMMTELHEGGEDLSGAVPILEDEENEGIVDLLVVNENIKSMLAMGCGYGQGVIRAHRYHVMRTCTHSTEMR